MAKLKGTVYSDGSYIPSTGFIGMAIILQMEGKGTQKLVYRRKNKSSQGANTAELRAVKTAIKAAYSLGVTKLIIYHYWDGVEMFSHPSNIKSRHRKFHFLRHYAEFVEKKRHNMGIKFVKVKSHSGVAGNVLVDKLAYQAAVC